MNQLDIVTVTFNSGRWLRLFDSMVREHTVNHFRHIYVDNGSADDSADWATIKVGWNSGYSAAANAGAKAGNAEFIAFVNPDVIVRPGWDEHLLSALRAKPDLAVVCPTYVNERAEYWNYNYEDWLCGACIITRRSVFTAVGGFDEQFYLGGEDPDYCWKVKKAGHQFGVIDARVMHYGGATLSDTPFRVEARKSMDKILMDRWGRTA